MIIIDKIKSFFFPYRCPYCNGVIEENKEGCERCIGNFPKEHIKSFAHGGYMCVSSFPYLECYKRAVTEFKFNNKRSFSHQMGITMARDIMKIYDDYHFDIITSVPLHKKKLKKRGYNQSMLLAEEIGKLIGIPYKDLLYKHKNNKIQHTLSRNERMKNVKNAYKVIDKSMVKGKNILIIDDIITTGYTLGECCKMLKNAKANLIVCATLCNSLPT